MSKARKRHRQRWQVRFRRSMRWMKRRAELRKLGLLPPIMVVRFDDVMLSVYPKGIQ